MRPQSNITRPLSERGVKLVAYADANLALSQAAHNLEFLVLKHDASLSSDVLPRVKIPREDLTHVFETLIAEGIRARGEAPPWIHVSAHKGDELWIFKVEDNGIGFEPLRSDRVVRLFERRAENCRSFVENAGGEVWAESRERNGSAFYFSVPA